MTLPSVNDRANRKTIIANAKEACEQANTCAAREEMLGRTPVNYLALGAHITTLVEEVALAEADAEADIQAARAKRNEANAAAVEAYRARDRALAENARLRDELAAERTAHTATKERLAASFSQDEIPR